MGGIPAQMPSLAWKSRSAADEQRLATWLSEVLPHLYGYFLPRVGGDSSLAEDLTQDTLLAATRSDSRGIAQPRAWLFGIARHKLVDHYRTAFKTSDLDTGPIDESTAGLPDLDLEQVEVRDAIVRVLSSLPVRQRLAIILRYFDDLTVRDVAHELGLTEVATESLLARARRAFREAWLHAEGDLA